MCRIKSVLYAFILLCIIISCNKKDKPVPEITLSNITTSIDLKLSDIVSDIKIVPLEFVEEYPLTDRSNIIIGEKYILCTTRSGVLQYSSEGKFMRLLAKRGKGPGELDRITTPVINKDESLVYFRNNYDDKKIECINLETGEFEESVPLATGEGMESVVYTEDDYLLIIPSNWAPSEYLYFFQDLDGQFITGHEMKRDGLIQLNFTFIRPTLINDEFMYYHSKFTGDTLFLISESGIEPFLVFKENQTGSVTGDPGYVPIVRIATNYYFFIEQYLFNDQGGRESDLNYIVDPDKLDIRGIRSFTNDLTGARYESDNMASFFFTKFRTNTSKDLIAHVVSAMDLINSVTENQDKMNPDYKDEIMELVSGLTENDNQVLLIGKPKELRLKD